MLINDPPIQQAIAAQSGLTTQVWALFFNQIKKSLSASYPWKVAGFTVSTLPAASSYEGSMVYVSNESGGAVMAFSDGTNWRRLTDRSIVS